MTSHSNEEKRTVASVMAYLEDAISDKRSIAPSEWLNAAHFLNILMGEEQDILYELQQACAREKVEWMELGKSAAEAKVRVEASDAHRDMNRQRAKIERIVELIRISKIQAKTRVDEMRGY